ncbi:hypothetical protein MBLNU230_g3796t1 [Neophaeotheca triangularis]
MVHAHTLTAAAASLLLLPSALTAGIYGKDSGVLNVDGSNYQNLIAKSNYTSIVEFYAPWCGHCQNLKPAYEKAAKNLKGLAKVAAVNCDEEMNKPFCGQMDVKGFPTLKIVKPGKKPGKPIVEDYQGQRTAKAIVDSVVDKIPNHVKKVKDGDFESFLEGDGPKAILFSEKGAASALLKSIAIDFLGSIDVAQIRKTERQAVQVFGVEKYPALVLLPGGDKDPITYDGEMKKEAMVSFLTQAATPNPDPAPKKSKTSSSKSDKSASSAFSKTSASHASSEAAASAASQTAESLEDDSNPTASPDPQSPHSQPIDLRQAKPIASLISTNALHHACLNTRAGTCVLALHPSGEATEAENTAIISLSDIHHKYTTQNRNLFPFYQLPDAVPLAQDLRTLLNLSPNDIEIVATNAKRGWYRVYTPTPNGAPEVIYGMTALEDWIDAIRMGDLAKSPFPESSTLVPDHDSLPPLDPEADLEQKPEIPTYERGTAEEELERLKAELPEGLVMEGLEELDDAAVEKLMNAFAEKGMAGQEKVAKEEAGEGPDGQTVKGEPVAEGTGVPDTDEGHDEL